MTEAMNPVSDAAQYIACRSSDDHVSILLTGNLGIAEAMPLRAQLQDALVQPQNVVFDGGSVERIDAAALQVICAFCREVTHRKSSITWSAVSDGLQQAVSVLGLAESLGIASH